MCDAVAVRAQHGTLRDFHLKALQRAAYTDKIRNRELLLVRITVMEVQRSVVAEPTPLTAQGLLVVAKPRGNLLPPLVLSLPLAVLAFEAAVDLSADDGGNFEVPFLVLVAAVLAGLHRPGRQPQEWSQYNSFPPEEEGGRPAPSRRLHRVVQSFIPQEPRANATSGGGGQENLVLTKIEVDGFKNLIGFSVDFGPFTCIAGPNAVGNRRTHHTGEFG